MLRGIKADNFLEKGGNRDGLPSWMLRKIAYAGILQALGGEKYKTLTAIPWSPLFAHEPEWQGNKCKPWKPSMEIFMTLVFFTHVAAKTSSGVKNFFQFLAKISVKANQK